MLSRATIVALALSGAACGDAMHAADGKLADGTRDGELDVLADVSRDTGSDGAGQCVAPGALDPSFGGGGVAAPLFSTIASASRVLIDSDGLILVAGDVTADEAGELAVARYLGDGTLDATYGIGGVVRISPTGENMALFGAALQSDGKLVVTGGAYPMPPSIERIYVTRLGTDGSLDTSFGDGGTTLIQSAYSSYGIGVQIDAMGRVLVATALETGPDGADPTEMAALRLLADGSIDPSYGSGGLAPPAFTGEFDSPTDSALTGADELLVVGERDLGTSTAPPISIALARYTSDGALDATFGSAGVATVALPGSVSSSRMIVDGTGDALIAGATVPAHWMPVIGRIHPDGSDGSTVVSSFTGPTTWTAIGLAPDAATIYVAGAVGDAGGTTVGIARYDTAGVLDPTFGTAGLAVASLPQPSTLVSAMAVQPDGKIIVTGGAGDDQLVDFFTARFCP